MRVFIKNKNIFVCCYDPNKDRLTHQQLRFHPKTKELKLNKISLNTAWS